MDLTQTEVETIRNFLRSRPEPILGSALGAFLKSKWPSLDYKQTHGSLRAFVHALFGSSASVIGTGATTAYLLTDAGGGPDPLEENAWQVFHYPDAKEELYFNKTTKILIHRLPPDATAESAEGLVPIRRMTHDDQKELFRQFSHRYFNQDQQVEFASLLEGDQYWKHTLALVRKSGLHSQWLGFRHNWITELFETRAREAGLLEEDVKVALIQIQRVPFVHTPQKTWRPFTQRDKEIDCRDLLLQAIPFMSEDEILSLRLPLRSVLSALTRRTTN